jgi:hypothetical protein
VGMSDRSFTYTDGQYRTRVQRRLLKAVSAMMSLTRWEDFSCFPLSSSAICELDEVGYAPQDPLFFSRWRILGHSFGPMWNADPDDRAVIHEFPELSVGAGEQWRSDLLTPETQHTCNLSVTRPDAQTKNTSETNRNDDYSHYSVYLHGLGARDPPDGDRVGYISSSPASSLSTPDTLPHRLALRVVSRCPSAPGA